MVNINSELAQVGKIIDNILSSLLISKKNKNDRLLSAMNYAVIGSGKRLRAFLLIEAANIIGKFENEDDVFYIASALELIHSYSLVHDDLPSMDNSPLRRGKHSVHIAYDEATAVLVGDALQSLAFEMIAGDKHSIKKDVSLAICFELSKAIGFKGMAGGQMMDLTSEKRFGNFQISQEFITETQELKTGALFCFALKAGCMIGKGNQKEMKALISFGKYIGLAFQIVDDILDCLSSESELGKKVNADIKSGKTTYVGLMGIKESKEKVVQLIYQSKKELNFFGDKATKLKSLADFIENRKY